VNLLNILIVLVEKNGWELRARDNKCVLRIDDRVLSITETNGNIHIRGIYPNRSGYSPVFPGDRAPEIRYPSSGEPAQLEELITRMLPQYDRVFKAVAKRVSMPSKPKAKEREKSSPPDFFMANVLN
jgi:hypothetical protein